MKKYNISNSTDSRKRKRRSPNKSKRAERQPQGVNNFRYYQKSTLVSAASQHGSAAQQTLTHRLFSKRTRFMIATAVILGLILVELPVRLPPKIIIQSAGTTYEQLSPRKYQTASEHILGQQAVVPTKLTLNNASLESSLVKKFPEIQSAELNYSWFSWQPDLKINIFHPELILVNSDGKFLLGSNGTILARISRINSSNLSQVVDESNLDIKVGEIGLPESYVMFVADTAKRLRAHNIKISKLVLPASTTELDVKLAAESHYIKFNLRGNNRGQVGAFLAARQYLKRHDINVNQYIDARVPERIYFK